MGTLLREPPLFGIIRNCGESSAQIRLLDQAADMVGQHLDGGAVLAAVGDDDVRIALAGLDEGLVHGLDRGAVLGDDAVQRAAPLFDVPQDAAEDPLVRVGVYIDLVNRTGCTAPVQPGAECPPR